MLFRSKSFQTGGITLAYVAKTGNYTITENDYLIDVTANSPTITLPTAASVAGKSYIIKNSGTGTVTVDTTSSQTIDGALTQSFGQYTSLSVMSNGSNWIIN